MALQFMLPLLKIYINKKNKTCSFERNSKIPSDPITINLSLLVISCFVISNKINSKRDKYFFLITRLSNDSHNTSH